MVKFGEYIRSIIDSSKIKDKYIDYVSTYIDVIIIITIIIIIILFRYCSLLNSESISSLRFECVL